MLLHRADGYHQDGVMGFRANVLTLEFLEVVHETSCLAARANDLII
jgi:hypothetical protein